MKLANSITGLAATAALSFPALAQSVDCSTAKEDVAGLRTAFIGWLANRPHADRYDRVSLIADRAGIGRRARDFIEDHHHQVFQLDAVCRHCGVGIRTLQRSFREYFDISVRENLKAVRLNAVHRDLAAGDP